MNRKPQIHKRAIPLCVPDHSGNEWKYLKECLDTNWVSSAGPFVGRFESGIAGYVGASYGVATTSGTAALHVALLIAGITVNDEVLMPTLSFIAPANAIRYCGASPVFIDVEPKYWQIDINKIDNFLNHECVWRKGNLYNSKTGRRIKAVLPVHILGHPVDMGPLIEIAENFGLTVIEDATESLGGQYKGSNIGSLGDMGVFSFNGNKLITTGGGGMIVTDSEEWAEKARYLTTQAKDDNIEYIHNEIGYNYRMSNLQAALGCAQLETIEDKLTAKKLIADIYREAFNNIEGIETPSEAIWASSAWWLYTILINEAAFGKNSRDLLVELAGYGIQTRPLWQPLHQSKAHLDCQSYVCDTAEDLFRNALTLPSSVGLTDNDQQFVVDKIMKISN